MCLLVYPGGMARTNVNIDDELVDRVMRRYRLRTKRQAIDYALRRLDVLPMSLDEALAMEGTGTDAPLDEIRRPSSVPDL